MIEPDFSTKSLSEEFTVTKEQILQLNKAEELARSGKHQDAWSIYSNVIYKDEACVPAWLNMGVLAGALGYSPKEIDQYFDKAKQLAPNNPVVRFYNGINLLTGGDFAEGWKEYQWRKDRIQRKTSYHLFPCRIWAGEPLEGRTLSIHLEQGLGDEILAISMLSDVLAQKPKAVGLWCSRNLCELVRRSYPTVTVNAREDIKSGVDKIGQCDLQAGMSELGMYLRPNADSFPTSSTYLVPDAGLVETFRKAYKDKDKPLLGISWCSPNSPYAKDKDVDLSLFAEKCLQHIAPYYTIVSLQYGADRGKTWKVEKDWGIKIIEEGSFDPREDLDTFAAQVAAMDIVVSISNTTVHVAGALGKPVWNMIPTRNVKLWYWFRNHSRSLWYPSMKLYSMGARDNLTSIKYSLHDAYFRGDFSNGNRPDDAEYRDPDDMDEEEDDAGGNN